MFEDNYNKSNVTKAVNAVLKDDPRPSSKNPYKDFLRYILRMSQKR